jgi:hypothetical protein
MPLHKIDKNLLRQLCARPELSDVDIAARFGVTREAIRLARNNLGITGRGLARLRASRQRARELKRQKIFDRNPILQTVAAHARKAGITFEFLMHPPRGHWMRIGNTVCYQIKGSPRRAFRYRGNSYVTLRRPKARRHFDLLVVKLPRGWLIVPPDRVPKTETMFTVGRKKKKPGATRYRLDWANYYHRGLDWLLTLRVSVPAHAVE